MNRRAFLSAIAALPILTHSPAFAAGVNAASINAYLVKLRSAEGRFEQTNPNGSRQTGRFMLAKPGRIRFEYDKPKGAMVLADGKWVGVFDPKSNRNPTRYPLSKTPLQMLLRDNISLTEPGLVLGATRDNNGVHITVVDPKMPKGGRLVMSFDESPVELTQWEVITKSGQRTRIAISNLTQGTSFSKSLFNIELAAANYK